MTKLKGKIAIVTGAGKGLGAAIARAYGAEGATVIVSDINVEAATQVAASIPNACAVACDVRQPEQVEALVEQAVSRYGRLDVMVPNAGIVNIAPLAQMSYEQWRDVTSVNLDGVFLCIRYAAPVMIARGGGVIVNMCSITAQAGTPLIGSYAAAKAGVMSLTATAAMELRGYGIRVNALLPGFIDTDMIKANKHEFEELLKLPISFDEIIAMKQGRYGTEHEVANLAVFLASERSSFSTGSGFVLDGGARASLI